MSSNDTVKQELTNVNGTGLLDEVDNMFKQMGDQDSQLFRDLSGRLGNVGISPDKFRRAGETIKDAQTEFFEGKSILEDLYASQAIKNLSRYRTMPGELDKAPMLFIGENIVASKDNKSNTKIRK